jgi:transcriptional regulator with XRE-family HTH domain
MPGEREQEPVSSGVELGHRIRKLRRTLQKKAGTKMTQTEFGNRYGVNQVTVSRWEKGLHRPENEHLQKLVDDGLYESEASEEGSYQMDLPFDRTFVVELKIGPQRADSVSLKLRLRELAN